VANIDTMRQEAIYQELLRFPIHPCPERRPKARELWQTSFTNAEMLDDEPADVRMVVISKEPNQDIRRSELTESGPDWLTFNWG